MLPLAISFFTFQQILYQVGNYKNNKKNIINYVLCKFFPTING